MVGLSVTYNVVNVLLVVWFCLPRSFLAVYHDHEQHEQHDHEKQQIDVVNAPTDSSVMNDPQKDDMSIDSVSLAVLEEAFGQPATGTDVEQDDLPIPVIDTKRPSQEGLGVFPSTRSTSKPVYFYGIPEKLLPKLDFNTELLPFCLCLEACKSPWTNIPLEPILPVLKSKLRNSVSLNSNW